MGVPSRTSASTPALDQTYRTFRSSSGRCAHPRHQAEGNPQVLIIAPLLIDNDCDVKTVQARMRHQSARTTLDVYGHLWPDKDETTRTAIGGVIAARVASSIEDPAGALRAKRP